MNTERITPLSGEKYVHFKGGIYQVVGVATQTETGAKLVVYCPINEQGQIQEKTLYARPIEMFLETIEIDGGKIQRFKLLPK